MTELELHRGNTALVLAPAGRPDLEDWAAQMTFAGTIARGVAGTPFVPKSLRVYYRPENSNRDEIDIPGTTASVAAALLTGTEVGLEPMAALRSIDIIEGTPALRAMALRALVLRAGHDMWVEESTATRAIVKGIRSGSTHEQTSVWTWDRAKAAELTGKANWKRHPSAMLIARATAEVARLIAPDVLLGLPYAAEELADGDIVDEPETSTAPPPGRRTAQRKRRPTAQLPAASPGEDDPDLDEAVTAGAAEDDDPDDDADQVDDDAAEPADQVAEPEPVEEPIDRPDNSQLKAIQAGLVRLGVDPAQRLTIISRIVGREITSSADLYRAEALVILGEIHRREDEADR